jgi:signal transduction histidine kinase
VAHGRYPWPRPSPTLGNVDVSEPAPPPPLTRSQSTWRYVLAIVIGLVFVIGQLYDQYAGDFTALLAIDLALGAISVVLLRWRRSHPLAIALIINGLGAFSSAATGAAIVATASLATRRRWHEIVPVAAVVFIASGVYSTIHPDSEDAVLTVLFAVFFVVAVTATGMYVGARRELVATLHERADRAEREQAMRVGQAQATERGRIAREMHDVLAHRMSLVAMHAGALSYRRGLTEAEVAESADVIRSNAHRALADLREILGLLRATEADGPPDSPQPTLVDLPSLVDEARGSGTHVRLDNQIGDLAQTPDIIGRSAYRMIQESLTNARKHAPDTAVDVVLSGCQGGELRLEVRNPIRVGAAASATPGSGLGLVGLTERAELIGGRLEHAASDGEFVVRAWLPWPP